MHVECYSVLSTLIEADNISRFGRYQYIGKTQISDQPGRYVGRSLLQNMKVLL